MAKILVVDDNPDAAYTTAALLGLDGNHDIRLAFDGLQAVEAARVFQPDLVILDLNMPVMDGHEAAAVLRREQLPGRALVLIALTGRTHTDDVDRAFRSGFDHHLAKPVLAGALLCLIARSLEPNAPPETDRSG